MNNEGFKTTHLVKHMMLVVLQKQDQVFTSTARELCPNTPQKCVDW